MRTAVIVIGDLGRSPRMQYHAVSLAAAGSEVDLIGLEGAPTVPAVSENPRIRCHRLPDRAFAGRATGGVRRFVWGSALRAAGQAVRLFSTLMRIPKPDVILVQNPPAVPSLSMAWLAARLRGARFVIDWHNLSHTIAAVKVGERPSRGEVARARRAALGQARRRTPGGVAGHGGLAGARISREAGGRLRPAGGVVRTAVGGRRGGPLEQTLRRLPARRHAPGHRGVPDELDAGRRFRFVARSPRARRADADSAPIRAKRLAQAPHDAPGAKGTSRYSPCF